MTNSISNKIVMQSSIPNSVDFSPFMMISLVCFLAVLIIIFVGVWIEIEHKIFIRSILSLVALSTLSLALFILANNMDFEGRETASAETTETTPVEVLEEAIDFKSKKIGTMKIDAILDMVDMSNDLCVFVDTEETCYFVEFTSNNKILHTFIPLKEGQLEDAKFPLTLNYYKLTLEETIFHKETNHLNSEPEMLIIAESLIE